MSVEPRSLNQHLLAPAFPALSVISQTSRTGQGTKAEVRPGEAQGRAWPNRSQPDPFQPDRIQPDPDRRARPPVLPLAFANPSTPGPLRPVAPSHVDVPPTPMLCLRPLESRFSQHWQASERPVYQAGAVLMAALLLTVPGYGLRSFAVRPRPPLFVSHLNPLHVAKPSAGLAAVEAPPPLHARTQSFPRLPAPTHLRLVSAPTPAEAVVLPRALVPLVRVSADYPALARPAGVVGQVVVAVRIAPDGSVSEATRPFRRRKAHPRRARRGPPVALPTLHPNFKPIGSGDHDQLPLCSVTSMCSANSSAASTSRRATAGFARKCRCT